MPAILDGEEAVSKWLDFGEVSTQEALKLIHPIDNITFHPVSPVVNNSRNNTPECLAPADLLVKKVGTDLSILRPLLLRICPCAIRTLMFVSCDLNFRLGLTMPPWLS